MARNPTLINFNKPGQRLPAAAVGPAYQAGLTNINEFAPNQDMVDALLKTGSSTDPVQSNKEGMYRALQGVLGGYMKGRDKRNLRGQKDAYGEAVMKALMAGTPTEGTVGKAERIVTPIDNRVSSPDIANPIEGLTPAEFAGASLNSRMPLVPDSPAPASVDPSLLQTEIGIEPPPPAPTSILDDPSVPDVASLGLERIETPTGPGGQIIEQQYVPGTPGTPGGLQAMIDSLRGDGTRDPGLQSALNQTALTMQYGGLQDKAALDAAQAQFNRDMELKKAGLTPKAPSGTMAMYLLARQQEPGLTLAQYEKRTRNPLFNPEEVNQKVLSERYESSTEDLRDAERSLLDIGQMESLIETTYQGVGAELTLNIKKIGKALGFAVDDDLIANAEALRSKGMDFILKRIQKTKGAISEKEMAAFKQASANLGNTPEGNRRILALSRHIVGRQKAGAQAVRQAIANGKPIMEADDAGFAAMAAFTEQSEEWGRLTTATQIPLAAIQNGITQEDWDLLSDEEKRNF